MKSNHEIIISLDRRHADAIVDGSKRVELRRRSVNVQPGDRVWLYVKIPVAAVIGYVTVTAKHIDTPKKLWAKIGGSSGLTKNEFLAYFAGSDQAQAIAFRRIKKLKKAIPLNDLRTAPILFHPPQFYKKIQVGTLLHKQLNSALALR